MLDAFYYTVTILKKLKGSMIINTCCVYPIRYDFFIQVICCAYLMVNKKCSQAFVDALQQHGAKADLFLYEGKTHTDLFLQVVTVTEIFK